MKFMLLSYHDEDASDDAEKELCRDESIALCHEINGTGHFVAAAPLLPVATAISVRVRDGRRMVTDGPFAETHEQLGGYFIIEAETLEEAVEIAGRVPGARLGTVEVRPIMHIEGLPAH
jgi:hypothetical protein